MSDNHHEVYECQFFSWRIFRRAGGVWYADGRSNGSAIKRASLGSKNRNVATANLHELDRIQAEELGITPKRILGPTQKPLSLADGRKLYEAFASRPRVVGGVKASTEKRYRSILDKFEEFAASQGLSDWRQVTEQTLSNYGKHLSEQDYAYKTVYNELSMLKTAIRWLLKEGHLVGEPIDLRLVKAECERPYCYSETEVVAIIERCRKGAKLAWLEGVVVALSCTGLRISELASLKWSDVRFDENTLTIADESGFSAGRGESRSTKNSRSRHLPIHPKLLTVLRSLPRKSPHVFVGPRGGHLKPDTVRNILVREVIKPLAETFPKRFPGDRSFEDGRLHSFRHYFCSYCANKGVAERVVMAWLGHADSQMVRHYYHLSDQESQRQMNQLNPAGKDIGRSDVIEEEN